MDVLWLAIYRQSTAPPPASDLERLACWAGGFTPRVSMVRTGLLLEVGACLRLFGGLDTLRQKIAQELAEQDVAFRIAVAATPQAALWLAEGGRGRGDGGDLDALMIADLAWPNGTVERLARFGLQTLGDVRRLSSAALTRRIGKEAVSLIARAYGESPDPRPDFVFPQRFDQTIQLPVPVENSAALVFVARRLTAALAGWLHARQAGLRECRLELIHRQGNSGLPLRFADATRDDARLERVMRERLERLSLAAPVESLRLVAEIVEPLAGSSGGLFDDAGTRENMAALVERLRARLGDERVFGIAPVADHRPECASQQIFPGICADIAASPRPFWLLVPPEPLAEVRGRPYRRGAMRLLAGPERIESGWWDQAERSGDLRRDYFIALTADVRWAWVFRELRSPGGWFLHGWFA
jgi:protein ImuB